MALKITKASQPIIVQTITACLYAPPGLGKTSTAFTAEKPLLLDFDKGSYRSQYRKDVVEVASWSDVESITADDLAPYQTIIVDTVGRALDVLAADLMKKNAKFKGFGGQLSLQGFGAMKAAFSGWLNLLRSFGKDVILISHMDEQHKGDETVERLDIQGGSKNEIYKAADVMGRLRIVDGRRVLDFNPSASGFGKNPAQLPLLTVPHFDTTPDFFAGVIEQIKSALNRQSEEAIQAQAELESMRSAFMALDGAEAFTAKAEELSAAEPKVKAVLNSVAVSKGFKFDKKAKAYVAGEAA